MFLEGKVICLILKLGCNIWKIKFCVRAKFQDIGLGIDLGILSCKNVKMMSKTDGPINMWTHPKKVFNVAVDSEGGGCIILYINGRKSLRWHVGRNQAANIDGSDLPLLTRPFLILVPIRSIWVCLDFMRHSSPCPSVTCRLHTRLCAQTMQDIASIFPGSS